MKIKELVREEASKWRRPSPDDWKGLGLVAAIGIASMIGLGVSENRDRSVQEERLRYEETGCFYERSFSGTMKYPIQLHCDTDSDNVPDSTRYVSFTPTMEQLREEGLEAWEVHAMVDDTTTHFQGSDTYQRINQDWRFQTGSDTVLSEITGCKDFPVYRGFRYDPHFGRRLHMGDDHLCDTDGDLLLESYIVRMYSGRSERDADTLRLNPKP